MSICLSNLTADHILRKLRTQGTQLNVVSAAAISEFAPDVEVASEIADEFGVTSSEQPEVLVGRQQDRRSNGSLITHLWKEAPPENSFYHLEEGIYLPTPCFCLLQQARELHFINLCQMLGYYLGTEEIKQVTEDGIRSITLPPLVTEEELWLYLKEAKGMKGVAPLRRALQYTCAGAASPQETNLQLMLTLPATCYGYGLKPPIMNYEIPLSPKAQLLYNRKSCRVDLYWKEADMGLEYQGEEHGKQLGKDYARFFALSVEGKNVLYLAKEQLHDANQMDYVAHRVAAAIGADVDGPWWPEKQHTERLIGILTGKLVPRKGEHRVLRRRN